MSILKNRICIGLSKSAPNYCAWLNRLHDGLEIVDLYTLPLDEALKKASTVAGILLTGGSDIHPTLYGRDEDLLYCRNVDTKRDVMEVKIIALALKLRIPLLGICRGQQMLNVAGKGTLYADIPAFFNTEIAHANDEDVFHAVTIQDNSLLFRLTGVSGGVVNSAHHQAVNHVAPGFRASACSSDGLIEAIEADSAINHLFCVAVQWHPERMNTDNPLSGLLGKAFIAAAFAHASEK
jgi:gamma-glutamyl-gamma-aminobutyrate hydrolase PuuD